MNGRIGICLALLLACAHSQTVPVAATPGQDVPPPPPSAQSRVDKAAELAKGGDVDGAVDVLESVTRNHPEVVAAWTQLGMAYERQGHPEKAQGAYERAISVQPEYARAWDNWGRLAVRTKSLKSVETAAQKTLGRDSGAVAVHAALAHLALARGQLLEAEASAKKALTADERNVRGMQLLAQVYYRQQKLELCRMVLENAKANEPKNPVTFHQLGLVALAQGQKAQALESFRQAVQLAPDFAEARNNLGMLLSESQDEEGAIRELEASVKAAPDFVAARMNLGNAYRGHQQPAKALEQYEKVKALAPELADTDFNLGVLHLDSAIPGLDGEERFRRAMSYFESYQSKGGQDGRVAQYLVDARKALEKEQRRKNRPPAPTSGAPTSPASSSSQQASSGSSDGVPPKSSDKLPSQPAEGKTP
jgi:Tfp pilus assembly protein PilF